MLNKYRHDPVGGGGGISNGKRDWIQEILGNKIAQQIDHKKKNKRKGKEGTNIYRMSVSIPCHPQTPLI